MSEKQLLLPAARFGVMHVRWSMRDYLFFCMLGVGAVVVLVGAASLASRAQRILASNALVIGPAAALEGGVLAPGP